MGENSTAKNVVGGITKVERVKRTNHLLGTHVFEMHCENPAPTLKILVSDGGLSSSIKGLRPNQPVFS